MSEIPDDIRRALFADRATFELGATIRQNRATMEALKMETLQLERTLSRTREDATKFRELPLWEQHKWNQIIDAEYSERQSA